MDSIYVNQQFYGEISSRNEIDVNPMCKMVYISLRNVPVRPRT